MPRPAHTFFFPYCSSWSVHTIAVCTVNVLLFCISCLICHRTEESSALTGCVCLSVWHCLSLSSCVLRPEQQTSVFEVSQMLNRCLGSHSKCLLNMRTRGKDRAEADLLHLCYSRYNCHLHEVWSLLVFSVSLKWKLWADWETNGTEQYHYGSFKCYYSSICTHSVAPCQIRKNSVVWMKLDL